MRSAPLVILGGIFLALAGCPSRLGVERRGDDGCPGGVCTVPTVPARPTPTRTVAVRVVAEDIPVDRHGFDPIGMTHAWRVLVPGVPPTFLEIPHRVTLDPILDDRDWCRMVAVHEFGHVIGLDHYGADAGWMGPASGPDAPLMEGPSPAELLRARSTSRGMQVALSMDASLTPLMREATRWAAWAWNRALEREVFVIPGE